MAAIFKQTSLYVEHNNYSKQSNKNTRVNHALEKYRLADGESSWRWQYCFAKAKGSICLLDTAFKSCIAEQPSAEKRILIFLSYVISR